MGFMRIGDIFRYSRPYDPGPSVIDGLPNYFHHTFTEGQSLSLLESGINPIQKIIGNNHRRPAILVSSSPHKIGSAETPWQDFFDPDNGHIRYFGDNKVPGNNPASPDGNKALLEQFELHTSLDRKKRLLACPIICFKRVRVGARAKGNVRFQGFGVISRAERVTQYDRKHDRPFTNYVYDFIIFSLAEENEEFDWGWVSGRRDSSLSNEEVLACSPRSWRTWVEKGPVALEKCRRRVVKLLTYTSREQRPLPGSHEWHALREIYSFYSVGKSRFEALASVVAARIIKGDGHSYRNGWITPATSDGGADFIGRIDIGTDLARVKVIVLGQAKCEKPDVATGGNHIARTAARLRRGWVGIYVTTSYFSEAVQREVLEDKYPIILVNGFRLANEVLSMVYEQGYATLDSFLNSIDKEYENQVVERDPEEILFF